LIDAHYLPLFFKHLAVLSEGTLATVVGAAPVHGGENDVFYGGIAIPTYNCAPYDSDETSEPDAFFNINSDSDYTDA